MLSKKVHVDYWNTDNKRTGGARVATFLGYLTDLDMGGRQDERLFIIQL